MSIENYIDSRSWQVPVLGRFLSARKCLKAAKAACAAIAVGAAAIVAGATLKVAVCSTLTLCALGAAAEFTKQPMVDPQVMARLDELNSRKREGVVVLVLRSKEDHNGALSNYADYSQWIQMAEKGCRVFVAVISKKNPIRAAISTASQIQRPKTLIMSAHGMEDGDGFKIGSDGDYSLDNIDKEDFQDLDPNATVILNVCWAGKKFAPELAKTIQRPVFASGEDVNSGESCLYYCDIHERHEITASSPFRSFLPTGASEEVCRPYDGIRMIMAKCLLNSGLRANSGIANALGILYESSSYYQSAFYWFSKAAAQGHVEAQCYLGGFYYSGLGPCEQDNAKAFEWYSKGTEQGNAYAQAVLGRFFENGLGPCEQNYDKAFEWYSKAAEQGDAYAQAALGRFFKKGLGPCEQNYDKAFEWYSKAAEQGDAYAQSALGLFFEKGLGSCEQNYDKAFEWYSKAAEQGDAYVQAVLGRFFEKGLGPCEQNYDKAFEWYSKAAAQGNAAAQLWLQNQAVS